MVGMRAGPEEVLPGCVSHHTVSQVYNTITTSSRADGKDDQVISAPEEAESLKHGANNTTASCWLECSSSSTSAEHVVPFIQYQCIAAVST